MNTYVYLAGPMTGLAWGDISGWRETATRLLLNEGIATRSPLRAKPHLRQSLPPDMEARWISWPAVLGRDFNDVSNAAAVLMNLSQATPTISLGTMVELGWAYALRVPVVLITGNNPQYKHPFTRAVPLEIVTTVEAGVEAIAELLGRRK